MADQDHKGDHKMKRKALHIAAGCLLAASVLSACASSGQTAAAGTQAAATAQAATSQAAEATAPAKTDTESAAADPNQTEAGSAVAAKTLPMEISQEDWEAAKQYVELSTGIRMAYVEMGDPDGEVLILQHGMTDNSRSWSMAAPYFTAAGYHVYLPDLRGMGKTDEPDGLYTTIDYANDLEAFFDAMGIEKATLVGHSLGSFTVQTFALMFPERTDKLVLVSSAPVKGYLDERLVGAYHKYVEPLGEEEHPSDAFMDNWYATNPQEEEISGIFDTFLSHMKKEAQCLSKKSWKNILLGLPASDLTELYTMADNTIPVLILHGSDDTMTLTEYQEELCELFGVEEDNYRNYEGIGHNIQFEIPKRCSEDILGWLQTGKLPAEDENGKTAAADKAETAAKEAGAAVPNAVVHNDPVKVTDYLYEVTYEDYGGNFKEAQQYFEKYKPVMGGCSSVQNGMIRGRNYDWTLDEAPEFVIRVPAAEDRHASIGVCTTTAITAAEVDSGEELDMYRYLPYFTLDGINDAGITININVVNFGEKGNFVMKTEDTADDICPLMVCRLVLDQAGSLEEAISLIGDMDLFSLGSLDECHFLISGPKSAKDPSFDTVVVELIPDAEGHYQLSVLDDANHDFVDDKPIMTNFHLTGFDGSEESLTTHPMGYERYQILAADYGQGSTVAGMKDLMKKVYYTRAYDPYADLCWYSDFAAGDLTMENRGETSLQGDVSRAGAYADSFREAFEIYQHADRDSEEKIWHTVHTSVYDIEHKTLSILPQEAGFSYEYSLE